MEIIMQVLMGKGLTGFDFGRYTYDRQTDRQTDKISLSFFAV